MKKKISAYDKTKPSPGMQFFSPSYKTTRKAALFSKQKGLHKSVPSNDAFANDTKPNSYMPAREIEKKKVKKKKEKNKKKIIENKTFSDQD